MVLGVGAWCGCLVWVLGVRLRTRHHHPAPSPSTLTQHPHPAPSPSTLTQHPHPAPSPSTLTRHPHPAPSRSTRHPTPYFLLSLSSACFACVAVKAVGKRWTSVSYARFALSICFNCSNVCPS